MRNRRGREHGYDRFADRLMLGTDWHTIVRNPKHEDSAPVTAGLFIQALGEDKLPGLMGGNALAFLGLDDPKTKSHARLAAFYTKNKIPVPKWWVVTVGAPAGAPHGVARTATAKARSGNVPHPVAEG